MSGIGVAPSQCPHRPPCPGCPRFGEPGIAPATRAKLDALARAHGVPAPPEVSGAPWGFRARARLAIRGRPGSPRVGMFQQGSHRLVHIPHCAVHHPRINEVAEVVRRAVAETGVAPYSEATHAGLARYLQVVVERATQAAQVVLVANSAEPAPLAACLDLVRDRLGERLHSLWFNAQCRPTNTILGPEFRKWCGADTVVERYGGAAVHYPPGAFGQGNLDLAARIVEHVRGQVPPGSCVAEFHAGVGAIGLSLLSRVSSIRMNEVSPHSLQGLALGCAGLEPDDRARVVVVPGPAAGCGEMADGADVVIVDPPRKGLDDALLGRLAAVPPPRLLYVSCGLDSLARDAVRLAAGGSLRLTGLQAYNLMPYTDHVETVARFDRN